jgi:phospholipase C
VRSDLFDHTSILKLIEWRWKLPNLTARDAPTSNITNLAAALDFAHPNPSVPALPTLITPVFNTCLPAPVQDQWDQLRRSPLLRNWHL